MTRYFSPPVARSFADFFGTHSFPNENQLFERLQFNLDYFKVNYMLLVTVLVMMVCIVRPLFALLALPIVVGSGYYLFGVRFTPIINPISDSPLTRRQVATTYVVSSLVVLSVFGRLPLVLALLVSSLLVVVHAITRQRSIAKKAKLAVNSVLPKTKLDRVYECVSNTLSDVFDGEGGLQVYNGTVRSGGSFAPIPMSPSNEYSGKDVEDLKRCVSDDDSDYDDVVARHRALHEVKYHNQGSIAEDSVYVPPPSTHGHPPHQYSANFMSPHTNTYLPTNQTRFDTVAQIRNKYATKSE